jgi:hypothetical protein
VRIEATSRSAHAIGWPTQMAPGDLSSLTSLVVERATSLAGIEACTALAELTLFACALPSLRGIASLPTLRSVRVLGCAIEAWSTAEWPEGLEEIEINFSSLTDARALLERARLRRLVLFGVPLDTASYDAVSSAQSARADRRMVDCDRREDWLLSRELAARSLPLTYSEVSLGPLLVRPGLPRRPGARVDAIAAYGKRVARALATLPHTASADELLEAGGYPDETPREDGPSLLMAHWERGDDADASAWIEESSLDARDRVDALRFVARFPSLTFVRERPLAHAREENLRGVTIPSLLKQWRREAIATVERPNRRMSVLLDGFELDAPWRSTNRWYEVGLLGRHSESLLGGLAEWADLYPIAFATDGLEPSIALAMSGRADGTLVAYDDDELHRAWRARASVAPAHAAFRSWASLLAHVRAVRIDGREIHAV